MFHIKGWALPVTEEGASEVSEALKVRGSAAVRTCGMCSKSKSGPIL